MPWQEVPAFYASLSDGSVTHLALRLVILTGVRSAPLHFLHDDQIEDDVWTIPAEAMKGRKDATVDFRVPLSTEAMAVIAEARRQARGGFLFPSVKRGVISDMTMAMLMTRAGHKARPHGFRSRCELPGGCPFGADLGDWSYHTSALGSDAPDEHS